MKLSFHGAARTVTGSKHIVSLDNGQKILLDCGLFQGMGRDTDDLNQHFGFPASEISVMVLSHAHIDHSGLIPKLVKEGFQGKIFCTPATRELADILLHDSAEIQTYETESINRRRSSKGLPPYEPLYSPEDVDAALKLFETRNFEEWFSILDGVDVFFTHTGHLIGSAAVSLRLTENGQQTRLLFTGDIGRYRSVLLQSPVEVPQADYIIMESTYGDKHHDISSDTVETIYKWVKKTCVDKGGQLIIPAFSVGRTQEVLYALNQLSLEKRLPDILYFIDSPLSLKATQTIKKYTDEFNDRLQQVLRIDDDPFEFPGLRYVESVEDSRRLVEYKEPCVILSASGTADAGRVRHHLNNSLGDAKNSVLLVGYCGPRSLGGQLAAGEKEVEIFHDSCEVRADIGQVHGLSAHGDSDDLLRFLSHMDAEVVKKVFLVHGEADVAKSFKSRLELKGFREVEIPEQHQEFDFSSSDQEVAAA